MSNENGFFGYRAFARKDFENALYIVAYAVRVVSYDFVSTTFHTLLSKTAENDRGEAVETFAARSTTKEGRKEGFPEPFISFKR